MRKVPLVMPEARSPVYDAVKNVVSLFDLDTQTCVFSYKNKKHFHYLWKLLNLNPPQLNELPRTFVIIWDGIPSREGQNDFANTSKYLTPIDWAIGFSITLLDATEKGSIKYPDLRIIIFDLSSKLYSQSDGLKFMDQFPKRSIQNLPWVRICSPGDGQSNWNICNFFNNIIGSGEDLAPSMKDLQGRKLDFVLLKNIWASILTRPSVPDDHHALANLIGPLLLSENASEDVQISALLALMRAIGLLPEGKEDSGALLTPDNPWIRWNETPWKDKLTYLTKRKRTLNIVLIDDQQKQGWGQVLCMALGVTYCPAESNVIGGNANIVVKAFDSPLELVESLANEGQRFRFSFGKDKETPDILLLDLRLFSDKGEKAEAAFFQTLTDLAEKFIDDGSNNLPWNGFTIEEIDKVRKWIKPENQKRGNHEYRIALTFLPRILSLIDFSLPIVIFSSTGKRDITENLKPYGNIITVFDKPKFTVDIPIDIADQTKTKFQAALERALQHLAAREKCRAIIERRNEVSKAVSNVQLQAGSAYVELFVDESGDETSNKFSVGGCFAVFHGNSLSEAKERADQFDDELVTEGIRYFDGLGVGPTPPKIKNKKDNSIVELCAVMKKSSNKPVLLGVVRLLSDPYRRIDVESGDLLHPDSIDNRYRLTLNALLELVIFETVPAISTALGKIKLVVSVYVATRVRFTESHYKIEKDRYRFGVSARRDEGNYMQYSISRDSIYPILMDVFTSHEKSISIERSLGIQLPYAKKATGYPDCFLCRKCKGLVNVNVKKDVINGQLSKPLTCITCGQSSNLRPDYRALHYIADEILSNFPDEKAPELYDPVFRASLSPGQFDDTFNEGLQRSLLASRALDRGDIINGVACVLVPANITPNSIPTAKEWIVMRIAPLLEYIDGSDFLGIVSELSDWDYKPYYSAVIKKRKSRKNPNTDIYFGTLQEGPEKDEDVFIPPKIYKSRVPLDGEVLRIQYFRGDTGLIAERLAL